MKHDSPSLDKLFLPRRTNRSTGLAVAAAAMLALVSTIDAQETKASMESAEAERILARNGALEPGVHDPSTIVRCKDEYWFFNTGRGVSSWRSKDLKRWDRGPAVFPEMPDWVQDVVPRNRGHFWAPDVIFLNDRYYLYYSISSFGRNTSAIALATNATLDPDDPNFEWKDEGVVIKSVSDDDFNAIDPAMIMTPEGELWMSFGSFWSGLKLFQLDPATGKRLDPDKPLISLAHYEAIEAPHIYFHDGFYYLFINWDRCCRGLESTYNIRVGRSRNIEGPYVDKEGVDLMNEGGTLLLETEQPFIGPGHANVYEEDGKYWFSCHYYDGTTERGQSKLAIRPLVWAEDGWPTLPPIELSEN